MNFQRFIRKFLFFLTGTLFFVFWSYSQQTYQQKLDCFSIVVGKNATVDGSVIFGHNEDTGTRLVNFYKVPQGSGHAGETIVFENGGLMVREKESMGFLWLNRPEVDVCDTYMNEAGVVIGSDGCPSREDQPDLDEGGIVYWLRRLVAEQARSAREGVRMAGALISKYGYASSGRTYIVADSEEAWLLAVVHGKNWVARRVPDDQIAVVANCYMLGEIDMKDTLNFMGSPGLVEYATRRGWYHPEKDGPFHFARAFSNPGSLTHPGNVNRMWLAVNLLSGRNYSLKEDFPAIFRPEKKISVGDVMNVLREHYDRKVLEESNACYPESPENMSNASICGKETQYSTVAHLRGWLPPAVGSVLWLAPFRPDVHAFSPLYPVVDSVPEIFGFGDYRFALEHQFDIAPKTYDRKNGHAFWAFTKLADQVDTQYGKRIPYVRNEWQSFEKEIYAQHKESDITFQEIYARDPLTAIKNMTRYCSGILIQQYKKAKKLARETSKQ